MRCLLLCLAACTILGCNKQDPTDAPGANPAGPGAQSYEAAMKVVCEAPTAMEKELSSADPAERARLLAGHISKNLTNEEAKALFGKLATMSPDTRRSEMQAALKKAGISESGCPMMTSL